MSDDLLLDFSSIPLWAQPIAQYMWRWGSLREDEKSYHDLDDISGFSLRGELGQGYLGPIVLAEKEVNSRTQLFALKETTLQPRHEDKDTYSTWRLPFGSIREFSIHSGLSKFQTEEDIDLIVKAHSIVSGGDRFPDSLFLSLEYCDSSLSEFIDDCADLGEEIGYANIKFLFQQLIQGIAWIHGKEIVHRDLSPGNVLLQMPQGRLRIADFGEARTCSIRYSEAKHRMTRRRTSIWWRAPEVCLGSEAYDLSIDIWAAGCILGEMVLLEPVFQGDTDIQMLQLMTTLLGSPSENDVQTLGQHEPDNFVTWCAGLKKGDSSAKGTIGVKFGGHGDLLLANLLKRLLAWNPSKRMTAEVALGQSGSDESVDAVATASAWWWKSPRAEDAMFEVDYKLRRRRV